MVKNKKEKYFALGALLVVLLGVSFIVYTIVGANSGDNAITVNYVKMTSIKTGTESFADDGLNYTDPNSEAYSATEGYSAGADSNDKNRIVRSFDTITYNFDYKIVAKNDSDEYDERRVDFLVELTPEESKYVAFERNGTPGEASHNFTFDNISTDNMEYASITLYILGAPNGTSISPKFTIKESTDQDAGKVLGNADSGKNYAFEDNRYKTTAEFMNYMPTVVSSTEGTVSLKVLTNSSDETQQAVYNNQVGRYITFVVGAKLNGNGTSGIKGYSMPTGKISFDIDFSQTGSNTPVFIDSWGRLYGDYRTEDINPVYVNIPFSTNHSNSKNKQIVNPGTVTLTPKGNGYTVSIDGYSTLYSHPTVGADNNSLESTDNYISSVAFTAFSPRTTTDGKNDITVTMNTTNASFTSTGGTPVNIANTTTSNVNKYYEAKDYSLVSGFYDENGSNKLAIEHNLNGNIMKNGTGALSKGTNFIYKIDFNYNKTLSNTGLKEIVKIDTNAFRFMPITDGVDYDIELNCGSEKCSISKDDFEVKFVTGSFDSANYDLADVSSLNITEVEKPDVVSRCSSIDLGSLNVNQVQNLYGGPCIVPKADVENEYSKISAAKDDEDKEIPITKAIVQTKEGVKLPDNIGITVKFNLRVRNVGDITQTYQATVLARTSDYDSEIAYYAPGIEGDDSVCNPNNYIKTVYQGVNIIDGDTSLFGDSLRIVNFTSREEISVKNKNSDGTMKTNYSVKDNDTITYNIKTIIEDNNENVGADDVWYINSLDVEVIVPKELEYVPDADLIKPVGDPELQPDGSILLRYSLPYTKPNMTIKDINFRARIKPTLTGSSSAVPITVYSKANAKNINGEIDNSIVGLLTADFTIYATGIDTIIVQQEVGESGTVIEKNGQADYVLKAFNNTNKAVENYTIVDVLPFKGDENGSEVDGSYSVKVTMPDSLANAKVYCSKDSTTKLKQEPLNKDNTWEECDVTEDFVNGVTAIKVEDISIPVNSYMGDIKLSLKTTGNKYSNVYANNFAGDDGKHETTTSNTVKVKVVSRKISGRVYIDVTGDGVKDGSEIYLKGIPVTLQRLGNDNEIENVAESETDKDGYYEFKDLDSGRYRVYLKYDSEKYDLTLRYASEDTTKDSDAYKVDDVGGAMISNKKIPDDPNGIRLSKQITSATDMDMGLLAKQNFGFTMKKYITRIDLDYNGTVNTTEYNNQSSVPITVRNSWNATAKVYYGIAITNNSIKAGYVNLIQEDIPRDMIFDSNYPENQDWFEVNGILQSTALSEVLIKPGETKYLQISLFMPKREEAGTFLNTVSVIESTIYDPEALANDNEYVNSNKFVIGDDLNYGGVDWHVIKADDQEDGSQIITLLADSGTISDLKAHTSSDSQVYKWSESNINSLINNEWPTTNNLNLSSLQDQVVCDDASGLPVGSYGGTMNGTCQSGMFTTSKVRLLTLDEYSTLTTSTGLSSLNWLYGTKDFWLQNSAYVTPDYMQRYINAYNNSFSNKEHTETYEDVSYGIQNNSVGNRAMSISVSGSVNETDLANVAKEVRPVITISTNNIVAE